MLDESLDVFMLLRLELSFAQELENLLTEICRASPPLERKVPRDPYSCVPVTRTLQSTLRTHTVCLEQVDLKRFRLSLCEALMAIMPFEPR